MKHYFIVIALLLSSTTGSADTLFVTLEKDNAVAIVDGETGQLLNTVPVGQRPRGVAFGKDKTLLYIATSDDDTIQILDTQTLKVVGALPSGDDPELFKIHPNGQ